MWHYVKEVSYCGKTYTRCSRDQTYVSADGKLVVSEEEDPSNYQGILAAQMQQSRQFMLARIGEAQAALTQLVGHDLEGALQFLECHFKNKVKHNRV